MFPADLKESVDTIREAIAVLRRYLDWDQALSRLGSLEAQASLDGFWDNPAQAQQVMREKDVLATQIQKCQMLEQNLEEHLALWELAAQENEPALMEEAVQQLEALRKISLRARLESMLSGEADANNCFVEVHAGAGGTEAQDWALMLCRMYSRWAEKTGYQVKILDESPGEEAGLKSVTLKIDSKKASHAYGWLKGESGIHRLVRISPFDGSGRRHTSFASVWVYPEVDDRINLDIQEKDLRIDTYRASGAGGQHVNKTESAIRITHLPTNIVVQCQNDRSQHRNKAQAMDMLKSRIYELELRKRAEAAQALNESKTEIGWGHQIRSYVLQPYQMIKDLRTHFETSNTQAILDGDLDGFLEATLIKRV
ncbi:MAG: peptide chain release factor 2 [Alphaproteobacteria bacterium]